MARNFISEDNIEQAILQKLNTEFSFALLNCYTAKPDNLNDGSGRSDKRDVILADRLKAACMRLNPAIPESTIDFAIEKIRDRRRTMSALAANHELYQLIRDGVPVEYDDVNGVKQYERVRLIDFDNPSVSENTANDYLAVSQLWIQSIGQAPKAAYRRPDIILYVNGLPLVFIELKNSNVKLRTAFDDNLKNYKHDIPQLFHCNAFCILSNAIESKVGSFTAGWEYFFNWLRVDNEKEKINRKQIESHGTSLEYMVAGLCQPHKLLDYVENFILFFKENSKIIAQNHQFIGVNNTYERFLNRKEHAGKLGVFWHTQGSGKSFSMIFYARKILRKVTGNFSFVVVTDRQDLDGQIYRNFLHTHTIGKEEAARPKDAQEMRKFLGQNKKVVFTLIQKFRYDKGKTYPHLFNPDEREIIVMVDEAHRTQYKDLAKNMRIGLKGAHFLAFTGTPLLGRERRTNSWFGDYVSEYNFQQAMADKATVPLFYQKRVPQMQNQNDNLSDEFYELLEDENLDEIQQSKLEKKFAKELEVIKRDDRLETIAKDIVYHFPRRGYLGKGMVISVDKFTAVKMYNKVQQNWKEEIKRLRGVINYTRNDIEKLHYKKIIEYMKSVDMAVVISDPKADEEKFEKAGMDIKPHAKRLEKLDNQGHDIEYNFKDPEHPLKLVFVCAMWLTGFDAPTVSTLYIDKPMKDHTLMQTIARANRVTSHQIMGYHGDLIEKKNGEIVDYYNVFRNMKKALKNYAQGEDGLDNAPVQNKENLFQLLDDAIEQTTTFCEQHKVDLKKILNKRSVFKNISMFEKYANQLLEYDEHHKSFYVYENTVSALYEACKPEILNDHSRPMIAVIQYLRGVLDSIIDRADIDQVSLKISELLDESVVVPDNDTMKLSDHHSKFGAIQKSKSWDLSKTNLDKLKEEFKNSQYKNIQITELRTFIDNKLQKMLEQNQTRIPFAQKFQEIIDNYNAGGSTNEQFYDELTKFVSALKDEDERHIRKNLNEDELELFDMLKKEKLTQKEEKQVKLAARHLIKRLLEGHPKVLVQDWWKDGQTLLQVKDAIEKVLHEDLPESYDRLLFKEKCENVLNMIVDGAASGKRWAA